MDRETARQEVRRHIKCTDFLEPSKGGLYCCPFCGSGHGKNGTGAVKYYPDTNTIACFGGCADGNQKGKSYDVLDLYQKTTGADYNTALSLLAGEIGITIDKYKPETSESRPKNDFKAQGGIKAPLNDKTPENGQKADYRPYYYYCRQRITEPEPAAYLKSRGISVETAAAYWIGYDPAADPAGTPGAIGGGYRPHPCPRLIIPTSNSHYVGRRIDGVSDFAKINAKGSKPGIFNSKALYAQDAQEIFIVEGAIDALSILQAGYVAVALNSAGNTGLFMDKVLENGGRERYKNTAFICCPDNDPDPKTKERVTGKFDELSLGLGSVGRCSFVSNICERLGYKDINDALVGNKDGLEKALKEDVETAQKLALSIQKTEPAGDSATDRDTMNKIKSLADKLRGCDTFSERKSIEQEIIKAVAGENEKEAPAADPLPCLLTYSLAVEIFQKANDRFLALKSFPVFSATAKIKIHDSVVIAADTGAGKSSLAINFLNELNEDYPCIYINLEMDTITVLRRLVAIQSGMEIDRIEGYKNDENTAAAVNTALQKITSRKSLQVIQGAYMLQQIQSIIEKSTTGREEPTIVIIDHSLLVDTMEHTGSRYDRFTRVSEGLRRMALTYNIIMFVLLQQNRAGKADNEKPQNSSLKESGSWENDATHICFLWYDAAVKKKKLLLTKNRNGSGGEFLLNYWKKTQTYTEVASATAATPATNDDIQHKQTKREKQKEKLLKAYEAAFSATSGNPTLKAMAEAADVTTATVKGWVKEYGGFMVNGQTVDPAGIDAVIEKDDFVKLAPGDNDPFDDPAAAAEDTDEAKYGRIIRNSTKK